MKQKILTLGLILMLLVVPAAAQEEVDQISYPWLITEVQTANNLGASNEYIEIVNTSFETAGIDGISLQYKSASGASWLTKARLTGSVGPRGRFLVATSAYEQAAQIMGGGLAGSGGHVRLLNDEDFVIDTLGWGTADSPEILAAIAPDSTQSLKRFVDEDGFFIDTNDNSQDFFVSVLPTPFSDPLILQEESASENSQDEPNDNPEEADDEDGVITEPHPAKNDPAVPESYKAINITELFIDPDKPLTDANDEFVEIFNPNKKAVNLKGYVIETGNTFSYSFSLPNIVLPPGEYLAVFSSDSNLTLSNTSGQARLLDPLGNEISVTAPYEKAKAGDSWILGSDGWSWSEVPSPNQSNHSSSGASPNSIIEDRSENVLSVAASNSSNSDSKSTEPRSVYQEPEDAQAAELNNTVLAGVGSMAILYAGYEYRHDAGNRVHQLREYIRTRRKNRK